MHLHEYVTKSKIIILSHVSKINEGQMFRDKLREAYDVCIKVECARNEKKGQTPMIFVEFGKLGGPQQRQSQHIHKYLHGFVKGSSR